MAMSMKVGPFSQLLERSLYPRTKLNSIRCVHNHALVIARRSRAPIELRANAKMIGPLRTRWEKDLPQGSPANALHLPLFRFIISNLNYPRSSLVGALAHGMPLIVDNPFTDVLVDKVRPATSEHSEWPKSIPLRNKMRVERTQRTQGSELALECGGRTLDEAKRGWVTTPEPATPEGIVSMPLTLRFAIRERHGSKLPKTRIADDFRDIESNELVSSMDANVPDALDAALSVAPLFGKLRPGVELKSSRPISAMPIGTSPSMPSSRDSLQFSSRTRRGRW